MVDFVNTTNRRQRKAPHCEGQLSRIRCWWTGTDCTTETNSTKANPRSCNTSNACTKCVSIWCLALSQLTTISLNHVTRFNVQRTACLKPRHLYRVLIEEDAYIPHTSRLRCTITRNPRLFQYLRFTKMVYPR
ncbi:MAG: hypothetical protein [Caudoviricetes sp.]|nr:MAG: hypothetical protein [Caudoviricetes sp.]